LQNPGTVRIVRGFDRYIRSGRAKPRCHRRLEPQFNCISPRADTLSPWRYGRWWGNTQHVHDGSILLSLFFRGACFNGASILPAIKLCAKAAVCADPVKPWIEIMGDIDRNRRVKRVLVHGAVHGADQ